MKESEIYDLVYNYKTKYKEGFVRDEMLDLINSLNILTEEFYEALGTNTAIVRNKEVITYHCDVENALSKVLNDKYLFFD